MVEGQVQGPVQGAVLRYCSRRKQTLSSTRLQNRLALVPPVHSFLSLLGIEVEGGRNVVSRTLLGGC